MRLRYGVICTIALIVWGTTVNAEDMTSKQTITSTPLEQKVSEQDYLFYQPDLKLGSETQFNPLTVIMNTGFDILRTSSYQSNPFKIKWSTASKNFVNNTFHPIKAIKDSGGFRKFVNHEVFPLEPVDENGGQFLANYTLHFLGEGMTSRKLSEWFDHKGFAYPRVWGIGSMLSAQILNEVVENSDFSGPNWDPVSDVLLFDLIGHLAFTLDPVADFFSTTCRVNYWGFQPVLDLRSGRLVNLGENIAFKVQLPWTSWRFFSMAGDGGIFGLSVPLGRQNTISFGYGKSLVAITADFNEKGARIQRRQGNFNNTFGVFWDVEESLVMSMRIAGTENNRFEFNLYPGLFKTLGWNQSGIGFGAYAIASELDGFIAGITLQNAPLVPGVSIAPADTSFEQF